MPIEKTLIWVSERTGLWFENQIFVDKENREINMSYSMREWHYWVCNIKQALNLTKLELNYVDEMEKTWYYLVWEKVENEPYPKYLTDFLSNWNELLVDWEEKELKRVSQWNDWKVLVFVKLDFWDEIKSGVVKNTINSVRELVDFIF